MWWTVWTIFQCWATQITRFCTFRPQNQLQKFCLGSQNWNLLFFNGFCSNLVQLAFSWLEIDMTSIFGGLGWFQGTQQSAEQSKCNFLGPRVLGTSLKFRVASKLVILWSKLATFVLNLSHFLSFWALWFAYQATQTSGIWPKVNFRKSQRGFRCYLNHWLTIRSDITATSTI